MMNYEFDGEVVLEGKDGKKIECEVLMSFEEDGHKYVVYTDKRLYNGNILRSYVSEVDESGEKPKLLEVEDMEILKKIQNKLNDLTPKLLEEKRKLSELNAETG